MFTKKSILYVAATASLLGLAACATPSTTTADRHDHNRDNKQGVAMTSSDSTAPVKPLHDHRDWK